MSLQICDISNRCSIIGIIVIICWILGITKIMSKDRPTETKNEHEEQLDNVLFGFVDDEIDYNASPNEIVQIVTNHTLAAIKKVQEMREEQEFSLD